MGEDRLAEGIAKYLAHLGISITPSEFCLELQSRGGILLLDGIDEAIKLAYWLLNGIRKLAEKYPNVQVITSSRVSGFYLEKIPFLAVTLLPFTDGQRNEFISKWFSEDKPHIEKIKIHLEKNKPISNIVKNPLLTTILCVLEENKIPLPNNEIKLHEERFRLLTGYYDLLKGVNRILSHRQILDLLTRRLAFHLHSHYKREEDRNILNEVSRKLMYKEFSQRVTTIALDELIDPCNVSYR